MAKTCHTDPGLVFAIGKVNIWASSASAVANNFDWTLVINAQGQSAFPSKSPVTTSCGAEKFVPEHLTAIAPPPHLNISWPDGGVPRVPASWWADLVAWLATLDSGDIVIHCMGGHGRTGTALTIIAGLAGLIPETEKKKGKKGKIVETPVCPVAWARKLYCDKAVETDEQLDYIEAILGRKVTSGASQGTYAHLAPFGSGFGTVGAHSGSSGALGGYSGNGTKTPVASEYVTTLSNGIVVWEDKHGFYTKSAGSIRSLTTLEKKMLNEFLAAEQGVFGDY